MFNQVYCFRFLIERFDGRDFYHFFAIVVMASKLGHLDDDFFIGECLFGREYKIEVWFGVEVDECSSGLLGVGEVESEKVVGLEFDVKCNDT